jgi:Mg2+ and Co2+ transporter CorA
VVDPIREHKIQEKIYKVWGAEIEGSSITERCFLGEINCYAKTRFAKELMKIKEQPLAASFGLILQRIIANIMARDTTDILYSLHDAMDNIDLSLSQDEIIRNSLGEWRHRFGHWRQELLHSTISVKQALRVLENHHKIVNNPAPPSSMLLQQVKTNLADLKLELDDALKRLNSTFQAVMSTMSILESQKAILEAEAVSKLTSLAFFFIPLTFVGTIFGMNVVVSCVW